MTAATTHGSGPTSDQRTRALEAQVRELAEQVAELRAKVEGSGPRFAALYADFTDEFRGTSDDVTAKLAGYLPDVRRLVEHAGEGVRVVDIGSGRGEWLGLLQDAGVNVAGVDVNPAFVRAGRARGLNMVDGDAVRYLRGLPNQSLDLVTAFHVIEHLDVETLLAVLEAARQALRPGGCVLFETPNPTNLQMAACDFYNDPTHRSPLPPALTRYLVAASGYERVEVRHLHPARSPLEDAPLEQASRNDVQPQGGGAPLFQRLLVHTLYGPQDYAVLGYTPAASGP